MYFSRLKTALVLAACLLGVLLCVPNLMPAPAAWVPWRGIHLGLDLRGGSYLLLEVDMATVLKERLNSLADAAREPLRPTPMARPIAIQPQANRLVVEIRDPAQRDAALTALKPLSSATASNRPDLEFTTEGANQIIVTLSPEALKEPLSSAGLHEPGVQRFGAEDQIAIRLEAQPTEAATQQVVSTVRTALDKAQPGSKIQRTDAVGASVSAELFQDAC
eukprot:gene5971-6043_t